MALGLHIVRGLAFATGLALLGRGASCAREGAGLSRNVYGNPASEELAQACRVPGTGATARLYRGTPLLSIDNGWETVTLQRRWRRELQFLHASGDPVLDAIACAPGGA